MGNPWHRRLGYYRHREDKVGDGGVGGAGEGGHPKG
jgi:hypothetical protein